MKISLRFLMAWSAWLVVAWAPLAQGQPKGVVLSTAIALRPAAATEGGVPTYDLPLSWSDQASGLLSVPLSNEQKQTLAVLGIQATSGIFVSDFPTTIEPGKTDAISFIYHAPDNSDGTAELIRLLTNQGIKEVRLRLLREQAVTADTREVRWSVGEERGAKVVTLTVKPGTVKPVRAATVGGNQVRLEAVNETTWTLAVTPEATARPGRFPVFVYFDKRLPGAAVVIQGSVEPLP
jgi:hypothetical protein